MGCQDPDGYFGVLKTDQHEPRIFIPTTVSLSLYGMPVLQSSPFLIHDLLLGV